MKKVIFILMVVLFVSMSSYAQDTTRVKVLGNCGMCKSHIEKAAKSAGATAAQWDKTSKVLSLVFDVNKTTIDKIEASVAAAGYDTEHATASDEAYKKLDECCQYKRKSKN